MFGNAYQSVIRTGNFLWEPVGILFALAFVWSLWRWRRNLRDPLPWCVAFGLLLAFLWRECFHIVSGRYHAVFIVPAVFVSFFALWDIFGKSPWRFWILAGICAALLARDVYYDPTDRVRLDFYGKVREDAAQFARKTGMSYTKHAMREKFYTRIDVTDGNYRVPEEVVLKQLDGNFQVWDGDWDAVYFFTELKQGMALPEGWLEANSRTGKLTVLGEACYDRHRRKSLVVLKYQPSRVPKEEIAGELLPNGDFRELLPEPENRKSVQRLGRRAERFLKPGVVLPREWGIYHALTGKSGSVATVVRHGTTSALRMESCGGYVAAISPAFPIPSARKIHFQAYSESEAELQLIREAGFAGGGGKMYTILTRKLPSGTRRKYRIVLPPFDGKGKNRIWFWLQKGTMELTDVRLE